MNLDLSAVAGAQTDALIIPVRVQDQHDSAGYLDGESCDTFEVCGRATRRKEPQR
jgi:hypothetical protein